MNNSMDNNCESPVNISNVEITASSSNEEQAQRPPLAQHLSPTSPGSTSFHSPLRHHKRGASQHRVVKETLNARSEYTNNLENGRGEHHINQYLIKEEIGRGSFGAVHYAVDQYGKEYAVKEFSKSRLRKRAQSNILRRPQGRGIRPGHLNAGTALNSPLHRHSASDIHNGEEKGNPLYLIKEEIAIMKKLNHPNLVSLIEVLDDPDEDSLYMVLEMCKKGVVMKVGLGERADPYDIESCRYWFRDLILGIEYLHAQGVVHRDIKPDNLLLTEDDVLKIVDFGVSEMFEKASDMRTAKSAGSPAFMPPELCISKHGDVSGKAADIWSMGISLYCLRFGRIPFERSGVLELYDAIKNDQFDCASEMEPDFLDVMHKLLEKDPNKRIKMSELREHPWVTKNGQDPLLSEEDNTSDLVQPPSAIEVNHAITTKMRNLLVMMKAVKKFKALLERKKDDAQKLSGTLGHKLHDLQVASSSGVFSRSGLLRTHGADANDSLESDTSNPSPSIKVNPDVSKSSDTKDDKPLNNDPPTESVEEQATDVHDKGHAHDPLDEQPLFLGIGTGGSDLLETPPQEIIAESPTAADFNIYDTAYQKEVERIRAAQGHSATVYLTRRVDRKKEYKADENMVEEPKDSEIKGRPHEGFKAKLDKAREEVKEHASSDRLEKGGRSFFDVAAKAMDGTRRFGRSVSDKGNKALDDALLKAVEKRKERSERKEGGTG